MNSLRIVFEFIKCKFQANSVYDLYIERTGLGLIQFYGYQL